MPSTPQQRSRIRDEVAALEQDFGDHSYLLFTAGLLLSTGDYDQLDRDSIFDGDEDKKIDFFHIDHDTGRALIIQAYERANWDYTVAKANKASDLNTASAWLLNSQLNTISRTDIRAAAEDLRDALTEGTIHEVALYYLHNGCPSPDVVAELLTARESLDTRLASWAEKSGSPILATAREINIDDVVDLYDSHHAAITVNDELSIATVSPPSPIDTNTWKGLQATVRASALVSLVDKYGDSLTSANIRDYLGRRNSARNINRQMRRTAEDEPLNFWVYNNGLTMITKSLSYAASSITCRGLAVTNGAQTLGTLAEAAKTVDLDSVLLPIRVVQSGDSELIQNIIRFNNTQNQIKPWELRVLDEVQARLQDDFSSDLGITYQFRRGRGRTPVQHVHLSKLAPWLDAFNGHPIRAHRNSPSLFENETIYRTLFNDSSDVHHLLAVYRIGEAVNATKDEYKSLVQEGKASESEEATYGYFRYGAFTTALVYFASEILLEIFGGSPNNKANIVLAHELEGDREKAIEHLKRLIKFTVAPIPSEVSDDDAFALFRSDAGISRIRDRVRVSVSQMLAVESTVVKEIAKGIQLAS